MKISDEDAHYLVEELLIYGNTSSRLSSSKWISNSESNATLLDVLPKTWQPIIEKYLSINNKLELHKGGISDQELVAYDVIPHLVYQKLTGRKLDPYAREWWIVDDDEADDYKETLDDNQEVLNQLWIALAAAGENVPAPEQDWRPSETIPEDFYAMNNPSYRWMSVELMDRFVPLARRMGVSGVARGAGGFVPTYRRAKKPQGMTDAWIRKRAGFIARHVAQGKKEGWWKNGEPTRRHLALIMWAYTPTPSRTLKYANDNL